MAAPPPPQPQNNTVIWVLIGCAGLLVLGLCVATGIGVWMYMGQDSTVVTTPPAYPQPQPIPQPGPGPALPPPPTMDVSPRMVTASVSSVGGSAPVQAGASCGFAVERHPHPDPPGYWCRAQIVCNGLLLYGGGNSGYFPCSLHDQPRRDVVGRDEQTTAQDTDASMILDTQQGTLTIRDDASGPHGAYTLEARITAVR
ncbi:MAG: hypothetical protein AAGE52_15465 [Myxococcota bacterium]